MKRLASLALVLSALVPALASAQDAYYAVPLGELEIASGALPTYGEQAPWDAWSEVAFLLPYAILEGEGEAVVAFGQGVEMPWAVAQMQGATLHVHTQEAREVRGRLFVPTAHWKGMERVDFVVPAAAADASHQAAFEEARAWELDQLLARGAAGAAWFRHERGALDEASDAVGPRTDVAALPDDDVSAYGLFSGGRALSENLQLERALPDAQPGDEVALADVKGIETPAYDWTARLAAEHAGEVALDPLAALVPADQHALFFPSFAELVRLVDEAETHGAPLVEAFEAQAASASTRERLERQLCLPLDEAARALGSLVVASVAITGSDPYLRTGSDVAVLLEPRDAAALEALLRARQDAALMQDVAGIEEVEGTIVPRWQGIEGEAVRYRGVVTPDRALSSYLARVGGSLVVTSSLRQLERIAKTQMAPRSGEGLFANIDFGASLAASDEYRFFRARYRRGEPESAFLVVPDAAIRRWCGPVWRIAAKRRTRAAAYLAEIQARGAIDLAAGRTPDAALLAPPAGAPPLGELSWSASGVVSSVYGSQVFQTPIAELDLARASTEEARLYGLWREGYERNWSAYFDPIAARLRADEDGTLALDLSVLPLILASDYRDFVSLTGDARLAPDAGDRHASALIHFAIALDTQGKLLSEVNQSLSGIMSDAGVDLLDWLGNALSLYVEPSPLWEEAASAEDPEQAIEDLWVDLEHVPIVLCLDVKSPLKLATFLVALRSLADQTAPGAARWETRSHGEARYVRIASDVVEDEFAFYYATPPGAFLLSLSEETLVTALDRVTARAQGGAAPEDAGTWLGESVGLEARAPAIGLLAHLVGDELERPLRHASWNNLPILNEWQRRFPGEDPVAVHERLWHERLECPGGGSYRWNEEWQTLESSVYGHPGEPRRGPDLPQPWASLDAARFGLTLREGGLRARAELARGE